MKPARSFHFKYIAGSIAAAFIALVGIVTDSPALYAVIPGIIGGGMAAVASWRFCSKKEDLAGFIATVCGFVYYQMFQANPVTLPDFSASMASIAMPDKAIGLFLGNLTTAFLLISCHIMSIALHRTTRAWTPDPVRVRRVEVDRTIMIGFWIVFAVVAAPNVLYGKVVVGAINTIRYQRMDTGSLDNYGGFTTGGSGFSGSLINIALWSTSLFLLWLYLLGSRYWKWMLIAGPLVLIWAASVLLQGTRTPLVTIGMAVIVYFVGNPHFGKKTFLMAFMGGAGLFVLVQISTLFRGGGLQTFDPKELAAHFFEIRGNEGASSQIDGIECFRTEYLDKGLAPNPVLGAFRGLVERPIECFLTPVPRSVFPWKSDDQSVHAYNIWYINVRLGQATDEEFLGASPGLIGRELIKYGLFGPLTLFFWLGLLLGLADRLYSTGQTSDFHRICAALLIAFIVAQARDFVPLWFVHFLPAGLVFGYVIRRAKKYHPATLRPASRRGLHPAN
jgi:hypothetical protein